MPIMQGLIMLAATSNSAMYDQLSPIFILHVFDPIICVFCPFAVRTLYLNGFRYPYVLSFKLIALTSIIDLLLPVSTKKFTGVPFISHSPVMKLELVRCQLVCVDRI